jgi:hypothetical protein
VTPRKLDRQRDATRRIIAGALAAKHGASDPVAIGLNRWGSGCPTFDLDLEQRAAVGAIGSGDGLVANETAILDLVTETSLVGRLGLRAIPPNAKVGAVDSGAASASVAESLAKPVGRLSLSSETLTIKKLVSLCVISEELLAANDPRAEDVIRSDLVRSVTMGSI